MEKYKAEFRHVLSYHKCGLKRKEGTTEVFFPISAHTALESQGKGSSPSCNSLSHISITKKSHTKLMKFLAVTLSKCVLLFTGCLGDFVRLASELAQVLHLVMRIPLWRVTADRPHISRCTEKNLHRTGRLLEQPMPPCCKNNSILVDTSYTVPLPQSRKCPLTNTESSSFSTVKRVENHGIRSISLNNVCEPTEVA